jgi:hypothetical protein
MNYSRSTIPGLLRRLGQYAPYVGCCCAEEDSPDKCRNSKNCARGDYRRALAALRLRINARPSQGKTPQGETR